MRVIIKPAGLFCLIAAFGVLAAVAIRSIRIAEGQMSPGAASSVAAAPVASPTPMAEATPAWGNPKAILEPDIVSNRWRLLLTNDAVAKSDAVEATVPGHPMARRVSMTKTTAQPWDIQIAHPLEGAFHKGQHLRLTFWGRSPQSLSISAVVERASAPYTKLKVRQVELTPAWQQFTEEWDQPEDTPASWAEVDFQTGAKPGVVEITGVTIDELTPVTP